MGRHGPGLLRPLRYGVSRFDVIALGGAVGFLGLAALVSSVLPAMRAMQVDPVLANRAE